MSSSVSFQAGEFSRPAIHDIIVGAMGEWKTTKESLGGTNVRANSLPKARRADVESQIAKLNALGDNLEDKSKRLEAFSQTAKKGGFSAAEAKALYCKSRIMFHLGQAAKKMNPNRTIDDGFYPAAKEAVKQTIDISTCGKDEVPVADENVKALLAIGGRCVDNAQAPYKSQIKKIVTTRNSSIYETHFGKAPTDVLAEGKETKPARKEGPTEGEDILKFPKKQEQEAKKDKKAA